jgi:hypothetical protein
MGAGQDAARFQGFEVAADGHAGNAHPFGGFRDGEESVAGEHLHQPRLAGAGRETALQGWGAIVQHPGVITQIRSGRVRICLILHIGECDAMILAKKQH